MQPVRGTYKNPTEVASLTGLPREGRKPVPPGAGEAASADARIARWGDPRARDS